MNRDELRYDLVKALLTGLHPHSPIEAVKVADQVLDTLAIPQVVSEDTRNAFIDRGKAEEHARIKTLLTQWSQFSVFVEFSRDATCDADWCRFKDSPEFRSWLGGN
jgi:hypothetical protein